MIAYCGLTCSKCPIHLATLEQDKLQQQALRAEIAKICYEQYGMNMQPNDIEDCDGCKANTVRLFSGCHNCEIRKCANSIDVENCAYCNDYACDKLNNFFLHNPDAQTRLEEIRNTLIN